MSALEPWTIAKSAQTYGLGHWGAGYFQINKKGHVAVTPDPAQPGQIDLFELIEAMHERDIKLPVLFRFNGILRHRVQAIYRAFAAAIDEYAYKGVYQPVYPIKVNQQHQVVAEINEAGRAFNMGLEVGSKPELVAVLAIQDNPDAPLICNGYKDREYIRLALTARRVGRRPLIVIEKPSEVSMVLDVARDLGIEPELGFRLRLTGKGAGRWEASGGERAKFGLNVPELVEALTELEAADALQYVKLLHFHVGSQLNRISSLKVALREASQVYVQLRKRCPEMSFLDVGGGLAVDYDGSQTAWESSMNYTLEEYARDVIWSVQQACDQAECPHPTIITECGRATVAYHSVLVFEVLDITQSLAGPCDPQHVLGTMEAPAVRNLAQLMLDLSPKNCQEILHDAVEARQDMLQQFALGLLTLEERAMGDRCYWALLEAITRAAEHLHYVPEDLQAIPALLTETYFCNLSIFQSLPDSWALDQIFPIMPVSRLREEPTRRVILGDITCDSDGKIDRFADLRDVNRYLPAHPLRAGERYYLAAFLVGAYQEILGDLHNLFGDTNAVHVDLNGDGRVELTNVVKGDSVRQVLNYVQYEKRDLLERWRHAVERAVSEGRLKPRESAAVLRQFEKAFDEYTYLR
ncbi:MAG: biosynthetic arginine decarboxylase [Candidatus Krumholzibacteriia bacterium]